MSASPTGGKPSGDEASIHVIEHTALGGSAGTRLEEAQLSDRQRLAVLLQGAALLAHLHRIGHFPASGWERARVTDEGLLEVDDIQSGHSRELPQVYLRQLLHGLFRADGERISGRGEARRIARFLADRWRQTLTPFTADRAVADLLEEADFLWQPSFATARMALAAEIRIEGRKYR